MNKRLMKKNITYTHDRHNAGWFYIKDIPDNGWFNYYKRFKNEPEVSTRIDLLRTGNIWNGHPYPNYVPKRQLGYQRKRWRDIKAHDRRVERGIVFGKHPESI